MLNEIGSNFFEYKLEGKPRSKKLWWETEEYNKVFFKSGRNAIKALARKLKLEGVEPKVLLPVYTCETVIQPFVDEEWNVEYYNVNADLTLNIESLADKVSSFSPSAVFFHSYFGLDTFRGDIDFIKRIHESGVLVIEDTTQSLFSEHSIEFADYYVTSLRKFLAIPDGGCIFSKKDLSFENVEAFDERIAPKAIDAFNLKNEYFDAPSAEKKQIFREMYGDLNTFIGDNSMIREISPESKVIFSLCNVQDIKDKRRGNYSFLREGVKKYNFISLACNIELGESAPLYLPIYVDGDRAKLQKHLAENNIFCPVIWPKPAQVVIGDVVTDYMYKQMLCFPIDQRYSSSDMERILSVLDEYSK